MREIEVLYFNGCPSWQNAWAVLGPVLAESGWEASVRLRDVTTMAPEELVGFAGSPTIRVDGVDLFGYVGPMVMACRRSHFRQRMATDGWVCARDAAYSRLTGWRQAQRHSHTVETGFS